VGIHAIELHTTLVLVILEIGNVAADNRTIRKNQDMKEIGATYLLCVRTGPRAKVR